MIVFEMSSDMAIVPRRKMGLSISSSAILTEVEDRMLVVKKVHSSCGYHP